MNGKLVEMNKNMREEAPDKCCSIAESMIEEVQFIGIARKKSTNPWDTPT